MLRALDVPRVALLSNNPDKAAQLTRLGITVTTQIPTAVHLSATNAGYLETKAWRGAHTLYLNHDDRRTPGTGVDQFDGQAVRGGTSAAVQRCEPSPSRGQDRQCDSTFGRRSG